MEEKFVENTVENNSQNKAENSKNNSQKQIAGAIILAGVLIAGAILLKGNTAPSTVGNIDNFKNIQLKPVGADDNILGNQKAKVALVMYEDFQCPWCGKFVAESEKNIRESYVKNGKVQLVYRDFPFLGDQAKQAGLEDESTKAAEAARCAGDQSKFWEYHDYLYSHQNGENQGNFSIARLKSFAKEINLDSSSFDQCLDGNKYAEAVLDSKNEASRAGVMGTPKGFILKNGKIVDTIDGYLSIAEVTQKIEKALK